MKYWVSQNTPIKQLTQINFHLKTLIDYEELSNDIIKTTMIDIIKDNEINEEVRLDAIDHLRRAAKINFIKIRDYTKINSNSKIAILILILFFDLLQALIPFFRGLSSL